MKANMAGISFELIHAPGETDDMLYVWLPDRKILMCGDNLYKSFPNLYTIRGFWFRSLKNWYRSMDIISRQSCQLEPLGAMSPLY